LISKIILGLFFAIVLFQANQVYGAEEVSIITIDFVSVNEIDLDGGPQFIIAKVHIQNYDPRDGYHFMQVIRLSNGEIIKDTEIIPKEIVGGEDDDFFGVTISHYLEPGENDPNMIGDYGLRIYSEYGPTEAVETFSIIKSSMPIIIIPNTVEELVTSNSTSDIEELVTSNSTLDVEDIEELEIENSTQSDSKIPSWVREIFVWYANETISENELLAALEYLIAQGTIDVTSD
jgi:hypothetical protein